MTSSETKYDRIDRFRAANPGGHAVWSNRELLILRNLYPTASWTKMRSSLPLRTEAAIRVKAVSLSIMREINKRTPWLKTEKATLSELYPLATWEKICVALPRHPRESIAKMANSMRLSRDCAKKKSPYPIIQELRRIRRERGLLQDLLADELGTHRIQIAKWERGEIVPRLRMFFDWVQVLGFKLTLTPIND